MKGKIRYIVPKEGIQTMWAVFCIMENQFPPELASLRSADLAALSKNDLPETEQRVFNIRNEIVEFDSLLGIKRAA